MPDALTQWTSTVEAASDAGSKLPEKAHEVLIFGGTKPISKFEYTSLSRFCRLHHMGLKKLSESWKKSLRSRSLNVN